MEEQEEKNALESKEKKNLFKNHQKRKKRKRKENGFDYILIIAYTCYN